MTNYQILLTAFRSLHKRQREALAHHAKRGTRIICGPGSDAVYTDGKGGG